MGMNLDEPEFVELVGRIVGVDSPDFSANFFAIGGDSLAAMNLSATLEERWGILLDISDVTLADSLSDIYSALRASVIR